MHFLPQFRTKRLNNRRPGICGSKRHDPPSRQPEVATCWVSRSADYDALGFEAVEQRAALGFDNPSFDTRPTSHHGEVFTTGDGLLLQRHQQRVGQGRKPREVDFLICTASRQQQRGFDWRF